MGYTFPQMKTRLMMLPLLALCVGGCDSIKKIKELAKATETAEKKAKEGLAEVAAESGAVHSLTADDFEDFTNQADRLVVVDFYADWCGPCKRLAPMLEKLAVEYGDQLAVGKLDVDAHGSVAKKHGVGGIPDMRFFRNGRQVDKIVGLPPERTLRSHIERHMAAVAEPPVEDKKPTREVRTTDGKDPAPEKPIEEKPKEPAMQPMKKDWMPPGMERRSG